MTTTGGGRIRRTVIVAVLVPVVAVVALGLLTARTAELDRREAEQEQWALRDMVLLTEFAVAAESEIGLNLSWLADVGMGAPENDSDVRLLGERITSTLWLTVDRAVAGLADLSDSTQASGSFERAAEEIAPMREAWDARRPDDLADAIEAVQTGIISRADGALTELSTTVELQIGAEFARLNQTLTEEGQFGMRAVIAGWLPSDSRDEFVALIDRSDRGLDSIISQLPPELVDQGESVRNTLRSGVWADFRLRVLALPSEPTESTMTAEELGSLLFVASAFIVELGDLGFEYADRALADAGERGDAAALRRNVLLGAVLLIVVVSVAVAVRISRRLTRRLALLQDTASRIARGELEGSEPWRAGRHPDELDALGEVLDDLRSTVSTAQRQVVALAEGRYDDEILQVELPGAAGKDLRLGLRRLGSSAAELAHMADHDTLTGLLSRRGFTDRVDELLATGNPTAVVYIDLDDFKPINDEHGHSAGDEVLRHIARRLHDLVRNGDAVARLGGDEFALAVAALHPASVADLMDRIVSRLGDPIRLESGLTVGVGASVGGTIAGPADDLDDVLRRADQEMYAAKRAGKNRAVLGTV